MDYLCICSKFLNTNTGLGPKLMGSAEPVTCTADLPLLIRSDILLKYNGIRLNELDETSKDTSFSTKRNSAYLVYNFTFDWALEALKS